MDGILGTIFYSVLLVLGGYLLSCVFHSKVKSWLGLKD